MSKVRSTFTRALSTAPPVPPKVLNPHLLYKPTLAAGAGPFPIGSLDREASINQASKKWKQLNKVEKTGEAVRQSSSLVVVLFGAGLAGLVIYATGTELFANNSPTRIFEDCVERIKENSEINALIPPPITFHGSTSTNRIRRNRRVSSTVTTDSTGRETMLVRFWIEGKQPTNGEEQEIHWFDKIKYYISPLIFEDSKNPGAFVPKPTITKKIEVVVPEVEQVSWSSWAGKGLMNGVASLFGGIIPARKEDGKPVQQGLFKRVMRPKPGEHWTGEAFAELKKDDIGNFVYTQLYVDIPDSRATFAYRIKINIAPKDNSFIPAEYRFWETKPE